MRITGLYVALAALLVVILAVRVTLSPARDQASASATAAMRCWRRIRAHANAIEYLPLALLLLLMLELNQTQPMLLHVFGCVLIVARIAARDSDCRARRPHAGTLDRHGADLAHARGDGAAADLADVRMGSDLAARAFPLLARETQHFHSALAGDAAL